MKDNLLGIPEQRILIYIYRLDYFINRLNSIQGFPKYGRVPIIYLELKTQGFHPKRIYSHLKKLEQLGFIKSETISAHSFKGKWKRFYRITENYIDSLIEKEWKKECEGCKQKGSPTPPYPRILRSKKPTKEWRLRTAGVNFARFISKGHEATYLKNINAKWRPFFVFGDFTLPSPRSPKASSA